MIQLTSQPNHRQRVTQHLACLAFLLCLPTSFADDDQSTSPVQTTFVIVRHAERDGNQDKLSAKGQARAETLRTLGAGLRVTAVYSTNTQRTRNTAKPLADERKLKTQLYGRISRDWLDQLQQNHSGGVVLIVGHSNTTGVIAGLLANKSAFPIGHDEYDSMFVVTREGDRSDCVQLKYGEESTDDIHANHQK